MQEKSKSLKILYIAHERKLGGATLSLLSLLDEMKKRGHEIYVVVPTVKCPMAGELRKRKIPYIAVFFAWIQMPEYWNPVMKLCFRILYLLETVQISYVYHKIKEKQIDIIHSNSSVTDFGARLSRKLGCRHVWHIREFGDADYSLEYLKGKKKTWNDMNMCTDRFLFISNSLYQYFHEFADADKSEVVYNGISETYFLQRKYSNRKKIVFLISGTLTRKKGQMLVLKAAKELKKKYEDFEVWIAGATSSMSDSRVYEKELIEYINKYLVGTAVMLGKITDMRTLRQKADVEIVASDMEAFGRVTVEAMMGGMPVIASDSGANPELIEDGGDGFLFEKGNGESLKTKMECFMMKRELIKSMGTNAQRKAVQYFTLKDNINNIEKIYYSTVGKGV